MGTRLTPLAVVIAVVAAVLAGAGVVAVVAHDGDDDRTMSEAVVGVDTTTSTPPVVETTTTAVPAETTTAPPTTVGRTTTTRARTTTTRRTTTTTAPQATATTAAGRPVCAVDQIDVRVAPDAASYPTGQPVRMTTSLRNRSTNPCFYQGYSVVMNFLDPDRVAFLGTVVRLDDRTSTEFRPGETLTQSFTWDPASCQSPPVCNRPPPDIYAVEATWNFSGGRYGGTQDFILR